MFIYIHKALLLPTSMNTFGHFEGPNDWIL